MKEYWVDFSGWGSVRAESKEEAEGKFCEWVGSISDGFDFTLTEIGIEGIEADE